MKFKTLIIVIALLFAASVSFAGDKISIDDIYGTWINSEYKFGMYEAVIILNPDGTIVGYDKETDAEPEYTCQSTITDSWYDNEGNLWIKFDGPGVGVLNPNFYLYWLNKFSHDGTVWESVFSGVDYPTELSLIGGNYIIYYRQ
jgi:hypothetical protein